MLHYVKMVDRNIYFYPSGTPCSDCITYASDRDTCDGKQVVYVQDVKLFHGIGVMIILQIVMNYHVHQILIHIHVIIVRRRSCVSC